MLRNVLTTKRLERLGLVYLSGGTTLVLVSLGKVNTNINLYFGAGMFIIGIIFTHLWARSLAKDIREKIMKIEGGNIDSNGAHGKLERERNIK